MVFQKQVALLIAFAMVFGGLGLGDHSIAGIIIFLLGIALGVYTLFFWRNKDE